MSEYEIGKDILAIQQKLAIHEQRIVEILEWINKQQKPTTDSSSR
jgi:hypothetical protein